MKKSHRFNLKEFDMQYEFGGWVNLEDFFFGWLD